MRVASIGQNQTEVTANDRVTFVSYSTPVAVWPVGENFALVTSQFHSRTTTRHVNGFKTRYGLKEEVPVPQAEIEKIADGAPWEQYCPVHEHKLPGV